MNNILKQLFSVVRGDYPLQRAGDSFAAMLELARDMIVEADAIYWGEAMTPERRSALYESDVRMNQLERQVRKAVITHLSGPVPSDVPYGLLLMSLVKDIERLGDYAKNLTEIAPMTAGEGVPARLPEDETVGELRQITQAAVRIAQDAGRVYAKADREHAHELTVEGRAATKRCDRLITRIANSGYDAATAVNLTMATRFYKRILGHLLNLLSSVLMPLHKLDYYDETALQQR